MKTTSFGERKHLLEFLGVTQNPCTSTPRKFIQFSRIFRTRQIPLRNSSHKHLQHWSQWAASCCSPIPIKLPSNYKAITHVSITSATPQFTWSCTYTITVTPRMSPLQSPMFHQLKKDIFCLLSPASSLSSNWSAPKLSSDGLWPPVPMEMR